MSFVTRSELKFKLKGCLFQGGSRRGRCRGWGCRSSGGTCSCWSGCGGAPPKSRAPWTPTYVPGTTLTPQKTLKDPQPTVLMCIGHSRNSPTDERWETLTRWSGDTPSLCFLTVVTLRPQLPACSTAAVWRALPQSWWSFCSITCHAKGSFAHVPWSSSLDVPCRSLSSTATLTPPTSCCGSCGPSRRSDTLVWSTRLSSRVTLWLQTSLNSLRQHFSLILFVSLICFHWFCPDSGLSVLSSLVKLQYLNLASCSKLTDSCLQHITGPTFYVILTVRAETQVQI